MQCKRSWCHRRQPALIVAGLSAVRLFGISGSLQTASTNNAILTVASTVCPDGVGFSIFRDLRDIPPFDASIVDANAPQAVATLRREIASADGVVIASPEYAHSVPGVLKNALDWIVGSGEFANKPVAIITVSTTPTGGLRAQTALIQTLLAQSAEIVALLPIANSRLKTNEAGAIVHKPTLRRIRETLHALCERCEEMSAP